MRTRPRISLIIACAALLTSPCLAADPAGPADVVRPYLDNQTFLVARVDVQQLPLPELLQRATKVLKEMVNDPALEKSMDTSSAQLVALSDSFVLAGGKEIFAVLSMADMPYREPLLVITSSAPQNLDALQGLVGQIGGGRMEVRKAGPDRLLVGQAATLDRVQALDAPDRPAFTAGWQAAHPGAVQIVLAPSADQHRALKETFPDLPRPWQEVTGEALSDGIQWAALTITAAPQLKAELLIESEHNAAADRLGKLITSVLGEVAQQPPVKQIVPNAADLFALIQPKVTGQRVSVELKEDEKTLQVAMKPLASAIMAARTSAKRAQSTNNLKQIALAMHIYHDQHKRFPPRASYDKDGKPLLSWRVHLLPYLDQQALYNQFKLDEPWDSEHNMAAARAIPVQYLDPLANVEPFKTTYVLPIAEGTVFGGKESLRIRDIRDGTSLTILVLCAKPEKAVFWSKPEDLPVAEAGLKELLFDEQHPEFLAALCDGSARAFSQLTDPTTLWHLLLANDRQVIERDAIK